MSPAHLTAAEADWIEQRSEEELADDAEEHARDTLDAAFKDFPDVI